VRERRFYRHGAFLFFSYTHTHTHTHTRALSSSSLLPRRRVCVATV
jgi:hypothetical protein